jgi:hypothetical protein
MATMFAKMNPNFAARRMILRNVIPRFSNGLKAMQISKFQNDRFAAV